MRHDVRRPFPVVHGGENLRPQRGGEQPQRVTLGPRLGLGDDAGEHDADVSQRTVLRDREQPAHVPRLERQRRLLVRHRLVYTAVPRVRTLRLRRGSKHRRVHVGGCVIRGVRRGGALKEPAVCGGYDAEHVPELSPVAVISLIAPLAFHHRPTGLPEASRGLLEEVVTVDADQVGEVLRPHPVGVVGDQDRRLRPEHDVQVFFVLARAVAASDDAAVEQLAGGIQEFGHLPRVVPVAHGIDVHGTQLARRPEERVRVRPELGEHGHVTQAVEVTQGRVGPGERSVR